MNAYEAKQDARRDRLDRRSERLRQEAQRRFKTVDQIVQAIPMGQPVLVGHHSEKRHRRDLARMDTNMRAGVEAQKAAAEAAARAASVGTGGVSSDDPDAVVKLREELKAAEDRQDKMKRANAAIRKGDDQALADMGFSVNLIAKLKQPDCIGRAGFADYQLKNNGANIRRIRERIAYLERMAAKPSQVIETNEGLRIVDNADANRLQLFFDGKPSEEIRKGLKSYGFRWSPTEGAWQRQRGNGANYAAECIRRLLRPE